METDAEEKKARKTEARTCKERKYRATAECEHQNVERKKPCDTHKSDVEGTKAEASNIPRKSCAITTLEYKARLNNVRKHGFYLVQHQF